MAWLVLMATISLTACREPNNGARARSPAPIGGTVLERLDGPPYSYLRLQAGDGELWVAVPVAPVAVGSTVALRNGVTLRNYTATPLARRFDAITFGILEVRR